MAQPKKSALKPTGKKSGKKSTAQKVTKKIAKTKVGNIEESKYFYYDKNTKTYYPRTGKGTRPSNQNTQGTRKKILRKTKKLDKNERTGVFNDFIKSQEKKESIQKHSINIAHQNSIQQIKSLVVESVNHSGALTKANLQKFEKKSKKNFRKVISESASDTSVKDMEGLIEDIYDANESVKEKLKKMDKVTSRFNKSSANLMPGDEANNIIISNYKDKLQTKSGKNIPHLEISDEGYNDQAKEINLQLLGFKKDSSGNEMTSSKR